MRVYHLVYASIAAPEVGEADLERMTKTRIETFRQLGITGVLLYVPGYFLELLEGDPHHVLFAFDEIEQAEYHTQVCRVVQGNVGKRFFPDWRLGVITPGHTEKRHLHNDCKCLRDFMTQIPNVETEKKSIAMLRYFRKRASFSSCSHQQFGTLALAEIA